MIDKQSMASSLNWQRFAYAMYLIRCADTVSLMTLDEAHGFVERAMAGEFDADLRGWAPVPAAMETDRRLAQPIAILGLSTRAANALYHRWRVGTAPITTVGELMQLTKRELYMFKNVGKMTVDEIVEKLRAYGFELAG